MIQSAGIYTLANILNNAIPFLVLPVMTRFLTPEDYGTLSMFSVLVSIMTTFVGLNVHGAIARQFYEKESINFHKTVVLWPHRRRAEVSGISPQFICGTGYEGGRSI